MRPSFYRGDDFDAFGQKWLRIEAEIPEEFTVSKVALRIGNLPVFFFDNPEFPLDVELSARQTACLKDSSTIYMALYDEQGRKQTCEGSLTFNTRKQVV